MRGLIANPSALVAVLATTVSGSVCRSAAAYDYVIVGGGTSGLVVANRLSEDSGVSVLVIEAGGSVLNNTNVTSTNGYGLAFGTEIDWAFETTNQTYGGNRVQTMRAAKALGGTSTINGLAYTRAEVAQIDAWEQIGNEGWNWDSLFPYYKKSEHFQTPSPARVVSSHLTYDSEAHGTDGPLLAGWTWDQTNSSLPSILNETYQNMGVPWNPDVNNGSMAGFSVFPRTVDEEHSIREDAARAYYYPYQDRKNLKVLLDTRVHKIVWKTGSNATARGVQVTSSSGESYVVEASKEVILSAGALVSPRLLELSGVGNPTLLKELGIDTVVDLPTVGENLQDQMNNGLDFTSKNITVDGALTTVSYPTVSHLFGDDTESVAAAVKAALPEYAAQIASANGNVTSASDLLEFFELQWNLIFVSQAPAAEVLVSPSSGSWASEYWALLPFARGSIHSGSNSIDDAVINPNYFMSYWDLQSQVQVARYIRKLYQTAPFADYVLEETTPGSAISANASVEGWENWIKSDYRSNFHPVGTAAMMPKEKGGVVDANLKVYGTANVRVVDASILPFQVCGHLVSTLYAMSERAADLIKKA